MLSRILTPRTPRVAQSGPKVYFGTRAKSSAELEARAREAERDAPLVCLVPFIADGMPSISEGQAKDLERLGVSVHDFEIDIIEKELIQCPSK
jgi:hypothetical protein